MLDHGHSYHLGYESTKAYQAEMRAEVAQERRARQARVGHYGSSAARLMARLHQVYSACSRRWGTQQAAAPETGASADVPLVLR